MADLPAHTPRVVNRAQNFVHQAVLPSQGLFLKKLSKMCFFWDKKKFYKNDEKLLKNDEIVTQNVVKVKENL
jgi:hypothetical protein